MNYADQQKIYPSLLITVVATKDADVSNVIMLWIITLIT